MKVANGIGPMLSRLIRVMILELMMYVNSLIIAKYFAAPISSLFRRIVSTPLTLLYESDSVDLKNHFTYHEKKTRCIDRLYLCVTLQF